VGEGFAGKKKEHGKMISRRNFVKTSVLGSAAFAAAQTPLAAAMGNAAAGKQGLRLGANYTPRKRWWYCWLDWDQKSVEDDLRGVASLGLDHIRIQLLWPLFQPGITSVSERSLANLSSLLEAADHAGLDVEITVLNGWMSGLSYLPAWVAPVAIAEKGENWNMFTSRKVIEAEKLLFRRIVETVGTHRRFMGFDIGNELGVLQSLNNPATPEQADAWATEILGYCEEIAPGKFHVNGGDDSHWFADFGFTRKNLATQGSATVMHSYIYFTGVLERYKYNDPPSLHLADYMIELGAAYQTDPRRRVWVEEIGVANGWMPESYKPEFMEHTVRNIAATGKAWGITWWATHDIDPAMKDFNELEYNLGLLDLNNEPKPLGKKFAALAAELRRTPPAIEPRPLALVIPNAGLATKSWPADWRFCTPYMKLIIEGKTPQIVLESRAKDEAYLRSRGIGELVGI
jgi:endo-1,4-beta-mannosidase